jgi:hypothetical protein
MSANDWLTKKISITSLHLDSKNPRLGRETLSRAPREIIQYLFDNDKAIEVAESIATRGFFPNEPLLAVKEDDKYIVIEGNRRLAALKALHEPGLVEGSFGRRVARLSRKVLDLPSISTVPVTIAPNRRATDSQIVGRHVGTPVLAWKAENRASFILEKLEEGYDNDELRDELNFSETDIQKARQTRAIADMARSLDLPEEVKVKIDSPKVKIFTTLERIFDSSIGREFLHIDPDPEHGIKGTTTKVEFLKGFTKIVNDLLLGKQSSRSLNTNDDITAYFKTWKEDEIPAKKPGSFIPADIIQGRSIASSLTTGATSQPKQRTKGINKSVLPRDFKIRFGNDRLIDIRRELIKIKRDDLPNAGAVLLRVFFELSVTYYLEKTGDLEKVIIKLGGKGKLPYGTPQLKHLIPEINRIAKINLSPQQAIRVEKALRYDPAAPFSISDLHSFVHQPDLPGEREILQFWLRIEPLLRFMLEQEPKTP